MKISDILVDGLMSTRLFEIAFKKKIAIDNARRLQMQIARHLVKLEMYSNSEYVNHWTSEVNAWLHDIQDTKLKENNRPLNEKILYRILLDEPLGTVDDVQSRMNRIYNEQPKLHIDQPNADEISKILAWKLSRICHDIANTKFKDIKDY